MLVLLTTSFPIPHEGGLSTHFEMLQDCLSSRAPLLSAITRNSISRQRPLQMCARAVGIFSRELSAVAQAREVVYQLQLRIVRQLRAGSVALIHAHDPLAGAAAGRAAKALGVSLPVVQTVHGPLAREAASSGFDPQGVYCAELRRLERESYAACARVIAVDEGQRAILLEDFAVPPDRVVRIPNAVDIDSIAALVRAGGKPDRTDPYFLVPRRLVPKNGVDVAIRALAALGPSEARLVIAGEGPARRGLEELARSLGLNSRVEFLGHLPRERLMPLMHRSRAVIIPSAPHAGVVEATSLSAIEAMACGAPVIASAIGGLCEIITHNRTGYLCPAGDAAAFAEWMRRALGWEEAAREKLSNAASASVARAFGMHQWFEAISLVYGEAEQASPREAPQPALTAAS